MSKTTVHYLERWSKIDQIPDLLVDSRHAAGRKASVIADHKKKIPVVFSALFNKP
jgi:hypothetical protein